MKRAAPHPSVLAITPAVRSNAAAAKEASAHVLGAEAARKLAEIQINALSVLRGKCDECGNVPLPGTKLKFGAIIPAAGNKLMPEQVYIVPSDQLTKIKDVTVEFKGELNVSV